jgi:GDPmannose 4,6-dehydratase
VNQVIQKTALIVGITGQDGAYLAKHLLSLGYQVIGTSRDAQACNTANLEKLGIEKNLKLVSLAPNDFRSSLRCISDTTPDEIYNLSGQTSVGLSYEQPVECMESIAIGTLNILESIRYLGINTRFFSAGSSECYGDTGHDIANESSPFRPRSPYAVAKATSFWQVASYREAYGLFCCTGILANHESPLRSKRFVTQKIIQTAKRIKQGQSNELVLGNIDICRDWGWAPDYVVAMHLMLQSDMPKDYIIATGKTHSLREFIKCAFEALSLDYLKYLRTEASLFRPNDVNNSRLSPELINLEVGWKSTVTLYEIVDRMILAY